MAEGRAKRVVLHVYDLSQGLARQLSGTFLGKVIDGIWHTGIVAFGKEYWYGGGIQSAAPGQTPYGRPVRTITLGYTQVPEELFQEFLSEMSQRYSLEAYNLMSHNCNNFSDEVANLLVGTGIPDYIVGLPQEVLNSPMGALIAPMIQQLETTLRYNGVPQPPQMMVNPAASRAVAGGGLGPVGVSPLPTVAPTVNQDPRIGQAAENGQNASGESMVAEFGRQATQSGQQTSSSKSRDVEAQRAAVLSSTGKAPEGKILSLSAKPKVTVKDKTDVAADRSPPQSQSAVQDKSTLEEGLAPSQDFVKARDTAAGVAEGSSPPERDNAETSAAEQEKSSRGTSGKSTAGKAAVVDPLGGARARVQEEITREFSRLMADGRLAANEAAVLAMRQVMARHGLSSNSPRTRA